MKILGEHIFYKNILKDVNFNLQTGKITVLLGANGAGKTTLLRNILGFIKPDSGNILIDNICINNIPKFELAKIFGYLGQNIFPQWDLSVYDLVSLGRLPYQTNAHQNHQNILRALKALDISHLEQRKITQISGGELALALLARVFAGSPNFIFADEPLNHLDIAHQLQFIKSLREFSKNGGSALVIVHDLTMALHLGDEFILMKQGEIIANGEMNIVFTPENLKNAYNINAQIIKKDGQFGILV